jgi:hypothetical protein
VFQEGLLTKKRGGQMITNKQLGKDMYLYLDDERGGFHWECFSRTSKMKLFDDFSARTLAVLISLMSAAVAAGWSFFLTVFIGTTFFNGEMSCGIPLSVGPPIAILVGSVVFFPVFGRMRSLA